MGRTLEVAKNSNQNRVTDARTVAAETDGIETKPFAAEKTPKSLVPKPMERRDANRYPFSAAAMIFENESRVRLRARCSDLSVAGCYIDTINPFPERASVQVRLSSRQENLEIVAEVCFSQSGMGMGLVFCKMTPEQELILIEWLNHDAVEPTPMVERPEISDVPDSPDRILTLRLIRLLRSKGSLTEADISVLLSNHDVSDEELSCRPCADRL